ncbi:F-box/FBD/LRR-repeat protein At5g56420-like isoform X1 [Rhododendron vialii]|uniref:F-box/FBD/LRR-repeat protein At5g56420-like isoform X1 n=2 Tax=Rhododendron vialii TaxID=182163 RepID=UPI00265FF652|nr:F-box/FBD/LRR-repeat protein At5g56420-like isoform X1 [Rhododendron vialii]
MGFHFFDSKLQIKSRSQANTMREVMGSNSRRQMLCEEKQYEDRISNLPDSLIAQILSCLPTKYAVATSVLSTRWKQLWTSITSLDFDDELLLLPHNQTSNPMLHRIFTSFVCRVLSLHRGKCVQKFRLKCTHTCDVSHVNGWIADMVLRDVRELDLSVHVEHSILLPRKLFTCRTLVVLKLNDIYDVTVMDVPTSVSLPNLKILHLVGIGFVDDDSINRFLFGCPVLEELSMTRCVREDVGVINVVAPVLTSLIISECLAEYTHSLESKIVLDTPALLYLMISDLLREVIL